MADARDLYLVVDGDDLFRAPQKAAGRPPERHERLDYARLLHFASWEAFGERTVHPVYFQREHNTAAGFYGALRGFGYELRLSPYDDGFEVVKENIAGLLEELRGIDCDLVYAGGDSYFGRITSALRNLLHDETGPARNVAVIHFEGWRTIEDPELEYLDIVRDVGAMPESIYDGPAAAAYEGRPPSSYRAAGPSGGEAPAAMGTALEEARQRAEAEELRRAEEAEEAAAEEAPAEPEAAQEEAAPAADGQAAGATAPAGVSGSESIVLIDCENIDWHLSEMLGGVQHLSKETRPQWAVLKRYALERGAGTPVGIAAYLQYNEKIAGFARFLDAELGFRSVILQPEWVKDEDGRERRRSVVDEAINKVLDLLAELRWSGDVAVVTNDGGYLPRLEALHAAGGGGRISVIGFVDEMHAEYGRTEWLEKVDLEDDIGAFSYNVPRRFRPVEVDRYDAGSTLRDLFGAGG